MSNISTQATVNLTINGQQPIQVLQQLRQNALQLESAIARAAAAGNRTDLRRLRRELSDTRRQIREIESSTMQVVGTLSVALVDSSGGTRQTIAKISIIFGVEDCGIYCERAIAEVCRLKSYLIFQTVLLNKII